ncbi:MAG: hypothetical protein HF976_14340 [ANME-2 cluster archaeon]|nr:hypothetical protein [ANME-2 cluster archaeon]MBC2702552.1 hypothetical protein [ANME-2 cluster archaeon]MBC2708899.1 hypothetical protein [ANME-2 cluster archaeon]MBC2746783.1 hypothetical protein [ANME-2 cluster archaeon]
MKEYGFQRRTHCFRGSQNKTKIARNKDAVGFDENKDAAKEGETVAGVAREELERRSGEEVVSNGNYLNLTEKKSRKQ